MARSPSAACELNQMPMNIFVAVIPGPVARTAPVGDEPPDATGPPDAVAACTPPDPAAPTRGPSPDVPDAAAVAPSPGAAPSPLTPRAAGLAPSSTDNAPPLAPDACWPWYCTVDAQAPAISASTASIAVAPDRRSNITVQSA